MDDDNKPLTPAQVREKWDRGVKATRSERQTAAVNHAFIRNRMWVYWNRGSDRLEEVPRNPERVRASIARIGPDTRIIMSKLTRRPLQFEVPPTSPDDSAMRGSRIGESVLAQTARVQNWESIRLDHAYSAWEAGVAGLVVEWDDKAGTAIHTDEQTGRTIHLGDVKVTCVSLHEMSFEPGTRNGEKARYWTRGQALPPGEVRELYGLAKEPKADAQAIDAIHRVDDSRGSHTPLTMVYSHYMRPSDMNPDGRIVTVVGDEFVADSPWDYPWDDELNISLAVVEPIHGHWFGSTPVTDAVPIQAAYNASWSSIIEHMKNAGNARLWVPMGSVDDIEDLSDQSGEAVEYTPINNLRPTYESPPTMPDWWIRQPGMLEAAMDDTLSVHAISRGDAPTGVESGIAMSILAENDDTPVGMMARNLGDCWGRAASKVLKLYEQRAQETRIAMIQTPGSQGKIPEQVKWNGGDLSGQTTAIVPGDAVVPRNRSAQAAYAFQLYDRGMVTDPEQLARIADLPDQHDLLEGISPDSARAHRENNHMANGKARTVDIFDNHENHLRILRDYMRSERYENHPPDIQELFRLHGQAHEMYAAGYGAQQVQAAGLTPMAAVLPTMEPDVIPLEMLGNAEPGAAMAEPVPAAGTEIPEEPQEEEPDDEEQ